MKTKIFKYVFVLAVAAFGFSSYAAGCNFYRDLQVGSRGEDVRCLQDYLNTSGVASFTNPDGVFGLGTRQSVMQWQGAYGLPASGHFGALSRDKYFQLTGGSVGGGSVLGAFTSYDPNVSSNLTLAPLDARARAAIVDALQMIEDAEEEIEDSNRNTSSAEKKLRDAKDDLVDSLLAFFIDRDFNEAEDLAMDAFDNAEEAFEKAGGDRDRNDSDRDSALDAIRDARDAINDAEDEIEDADDDGDDVRDAEDLLDEAMDTLDDAEEEFDDRDYDRAEDLAMDAEELAEDAVDAID